MFWISAYPDTIISHRKKKSITHPERKILTAVELHTKSAPEPEGVYAYVEEGKRLNIKKRDEAPLFFYILRSIVSSGAK